MANITFIEDYLAQLAATDPTAQKIIDEIRARRKRRGRPRAPEGQYRRLELWWACFRKLNSSLTDEQAAKRFFRLRGNAIANELGLKREDYHSLRNAVRRGKKETERVKAQRTAEWQIIPTGLVDSVHGRFHRIATGRHETILIREAQRRALLGK